MHLSPLILNYFFIKNFKFELKAGFDENLNRDVISDTPKLNINVNAGNHSDNQRQWRFELSIEADEDSSEKDFPYTFEIILFGFFEVHESYPAEKAEMLARVNAPAVLYSAAREFLANITSRSPYPAILLPTVTFLNPQESTKLKEKKGRGKIEKNGEKKSKK